MKETKIGLGLAALGRPEYLNVRTVIDGDKTESYYAENALKVLDYAYGQGIRYFDTAPSYGLGESYLMKWNDTASRKNLFLSTKWGYTYVADWNIGFKGKHEIKEHSVEKLIEQWEVSKKLLPELKLYQIHSATFESGVFDNKEVLQKLYEIKNQTGLKIGATTSGTNQGEILKYAADIKVHNEFLFDSFQVTYNILESSSHSVLTDLIKTGRMIIVKEALANGRLFRNLNYKHYESLYLYMETLAEKYQVGVDAIALRFVMDNLQPSVVLSGASNENQLAENMKVMKFKLEKQELNSLRHHAIGSDTYWNERNKLQWN